MLICCCALNPQLLHEMKKVTFAEDIDNSLYESALEVIGETSRVYEELSSCRNAILDFFETNEESAQEFMHSIHIVDMDKTKNFLDSDSFWDAVVDMHVEVS